MTPTNQSHKKPAYQPPQLEVHQWTVITGISLPIGTAGFPENPLDELQDTLGGEQ